MTPQSIPERLEGEPDHRPASPAGVAAYVLKQLVAVVLLLPFGLLCSVLYFPCRLFFSRPPVVINPRLCRYFVRKAITEQTDDGSITTSMRLRVLLNIATVLLLGPGLGLAWFVDEIFFSRYKREKLVQPLFQISAARSGSTQMNHYLEQNPQIVAPMFIQQVLPFLWLWKIAPRTIGRLFTEERIQVPHSGRSSRRIP